jgi:hypothetical protein
MPYDNDYNKKIARDNSYFVKRFVEHTDALGTSQTINYVNPSVQGGAMVGGGVGCAEWKSSSASKHEAGEQAKCPCAEDGECLCGGTNLGHEQDPVGYGGAILGLQDKPVRKPRAKRTLKNFGTLGLTTNMSVRAPVMPAATAVRASAIKDPNSPLEAESAEEAKHLTVGGSKDKTSSPLRRGRPRKSGGNGFASGTHMDNGEGPHTDGVKPRKSKKSGGSTFNDEPVARKAARKANGDKYAAAKSGGGVVGDVIDFVKELMTPAKKAPSWVGADIAGDINERSARKKRAATRAKGWKAIGGAHTTDESGDPLLPTTTKRTVKSTAKKEVSPMTEKAQLPSSTLSGLGKVKRANPRAEIVKKVMADRGCSMIEASKAVKAEGLY